jgi:predicted DNA-binding transcriptional regulator YafY
MCIAIIHRCRNCERMLQFDNGEDRIYTDTCNEQGNHITEVVVDRKLTKNGTETEETLERPAQSEENRRLVRYVAGVGVSVRIMNMEELCKTCDIVEAETE